MFLWSLGQLTFLYNLRWFYLFGDIPLSFFDIFFGIKNNLAEARCLLDYSTKIKYLIQLSTVQTNRNIVDSSHCPGF